MVIPRWFYIGSVGVLFIAAVWVPTLIGGDNRFFTEQVTEGILIGIIVIIMVSMTRAYRKKLEQSNLELNDALAYIGSLNVRVESMHSLHESLQRFPQNKKDLKLLFDSLANKALAVTNSAWVLIRVIDKQSGHTCAEVAKARGKVLVLKHEIGNKELLQGYKEDGHLCIASAPVENTFLEAYCVFESDGKLDRHQEIILQSIVNNAVFMYLLFIHVGSHRKD